jgi:hypothetical protein
MKLWKWDVEFRLTLLFSANRTLLVASLDLSFLWFFWKIEALSANDVPQ